jgi:hypothetical protein
MAQLACEQGDGKNAVFVGTFLESGLSVALCNDDLVNFVVSMAQELTGAPVIDFVSTHQPEEVEQVTAPDDEAVAAALDTLLKANAPEVDRRLKEGEDMETIIADLMTRPDDDSSDAQPDSTPAA